MAPKSGTIRSVSTRTKAEQTGPKSSRQQFSACGACRMRRVRCDLKDLVIAFGGQKPPACTNCSSRGLKCVDEFADVKSVKLLRRGRRLQQVEQVYGKSSPTSSPHLSSPDRSGSVTRQSCIPDLDVQFFASPFFMAFNLQHSLLDPNEFSSRYMAHLKGTHPLGIEGQLLAKVLVIWAASFGVDQSGTDLTTFRPTSPPASSGSGSDVVGTHWRHEAEHSELRARRECTDVQVQELLNLIDVHGVMRKPTWDGVRVLLLIWPLTQGVQSALQRVTMYESTLSQIYALCSLENPSSVHSGQGPYADALVRARIFWYAHVHEGTINALRGARLVLTDDDLVLFQQTLPPCQGAVSTPASAAASSASLPSPVTPTHPNLEMHRCSASEQTHSRSSLAYVLATHYFSLTLNLSAVCRHIHTVLTGPKARRSAEGLDEDGLRDIWEGLERSWDEFEVVRRKGLGSTGFSIGSEDLDRFVSSWQVYIFECHHIIREALKQRVVSSSVPTAKSYCSSSSSGGSSASSTPSPESALRLHAHATRKCRALLPRVLAILQRHLATPVSIRGFFAYDAGLVKDGCFYAGLMLAQGDLDDDQGQPRLELELGMGLENGVEVCLRALDSMGWVFAKSGEKQQSIRMMWEARKMKEAERRGRRMSLHSRGEFEYEHHPQQQYHARYPEPTYTLRPIQPMGASTLPIPPAVSSRPVLAPLSVVTTNLCSTDPYSSPSTAYTDTGSWGMYTPPSTAQTQRSSPGALDEYLPAMTQYTGDANDVFYHSVPEIDSVPYDFTTASDAASCVGVKGMGVFIDHHQPQEFLDGVFGSVVAHSPHGSPQFDAYYQ